MKTEKYIFNFQPPLTPHPSVAKYFPSLRQTKDKTSSAAMSSSASKLTLQFSGRPGESAVGFDAVNKVLREVGVSIRPLKVPTKDAVLGALLDKSRKGKVLDPDYELPLFLHAFQVGRKEALAAAAHSGRSPAVTGGGALATEIDGVPPYPKVYDAAAMGPPSTRGEVYRTFGELHVNRAGAVGVDEAMQIVSSTEDLVWFFLHPKLGVLKLVIPPAIDEGFFLSYPGLTPHGAFMGAETAVIVATITGPPIWKMIRGGLPVNPWVDFESGVVLSEPRI